MILAGKCLGWLAVIWGVWELHPGLGWIVTGLVILGVVDSLALRYRNTIGGRGDAP